MGRFAEFLKTLNPVSGRLITEDGEAFNRADWYRDQLNTSLVPHVIGGNGSILSIRLTSLAGNGAEHHFVIDIPAGKELYLFSRVLNLTQGDYNIDAIAVDSVDLSSATTGASAPLDKISGQSVDTQLRHVVGNVTNPVVREFGFADTGAAQGGQSRAGGATSVDGVIKRLTGPSILRVVKPSEGTFTANLVYVCWEDDA